MSQSGQDERDLPVARDGQPGRRPRAAAGRTRRGRRRRGLRRAVLAEDTTDIRTASRQPAGRLGPRGRDRHVRPERTVPPREADGRKPRGGGRHLELRARHRDEDVRRPTRRLSSSPAATRRGRSGRSSDGSWASWHCCSRGVPSSLCSPTALPAAPARRSRVGPTGTQAERRAGQNRRRSTATTRRSPTAVAGTGAVTWAGQPLTRRHARRPPSRTTSRSAQTRRTVR